MKSKKAFLSSVLVILTLFFIQGSAWAVTRYVPSPYATIQAAINAASSGDVVEVTNSNTYTECITMKSGVDVTSSTGQTPTINCTTNETSTVSFTGAISNCDLDGFDIEHSSNTGAGIHLDGTSGTVSGVTISNCDINNIALAAGIRMSGTVTGCTIQSNDIRDISVGGGGHGATGGGIRMNDTINCSIINNTIDDCDGAGITSGNPNNEEYISDGSSISIKGNDIGISTSGMNRMRDAGIMLKGEPGVGKIVTIVIEPENGDNNIIKYCKDAGIRLERIDSLTVDGNSIFENGKAGMIIRDVGTSSVDAEVKNNTIYENGKGQRRSGINIGGESYLTIGPNNTIRNNNQAGVTFNIDNVSRTSYTLAPSSKPVTFTENDMYSNGTAAISIKENITDTVTITENDIYSNGYAGIGIQYNCTLVIEKNAIRDNTRGGIHTGTQSTDPGGFGGTNGSAVLTIKQNKIYDNGASDYGGGIDVRHASGTIYNNLVYGHRRGGIRFGDWITEIINNTVAHNGNDNDTPTTYGDDRGGGIIYDDIGQGDAVNAPPEGTLADSSNYPNPRIRNNICAYNVLAGIRVSYGPTGVYTCPGNPDYTDAIKYRDYNLLYSNHLWNTGQSRWNDPDCKYPNIDVSCINQQYGGCGWDWDAWDLVSPNDERQDPLFVSITEGSEDYHLQTTPTPSPAIDAGFDGNDMGAYGGSNPMTW